MNKKIFDFNRAIENLDIKHTENEDEIKGLDEYKKNKQAAINLTNQNIATAEKLFNENIAVLKQICPKAASEISLIEQHYKNRKSEEMKSTADLITSVEPNN
jgi:hypothetical protein